MNNSDNNDFQNWQNGDDEHDMRNPNNWLPKGGFFYYGPSDNFKKMFNNANNSDEFIENMKEYLHMDDILNQWAKQMPKKPAQRKPNRNKPNMPSPTIFSQDDYMKLIEIRGYLNITGQIAHVRALDKLINQIQIIPKDSK